jgi:hypothetical protein
VSTAYCAYNNEVINYHSAEENTKTEDWKTEKENIKILLMKYNLKKIQAIGQFSYNFNKFSEKSPPWNPHHWIHQW